MIEHYRLTEEMIAKAMAAYHAAGGGDEACVRAALEAAFADEEHFAVGDEVECARGCVAGVILAISGDEAQISWACRGKSAEKLSNLVHMENPELHGR
jgi:2-hydroxychromene-2-carboxylate isomerase